MGQGRFFPTAFGRKSNHTSLDSDMMYEKTTNFVLQACACFFFLRCTVLIAWNGWRCFAGLRCELVQVLLCFLLAFDERLEEARFCGRQGLRPHGHGLDVFLERFVFCKSVFSGCR